MPKQFFVYITTNKWNNVLYTGFTGNLPRRITEHKSGSILGFTSRYRVNKLVYFERYTSATQARSREKQIKAGSRAKKLQLIWEINPKLEDLSPKLLFK